MILLNTLKQTAYKLRLLVALIFVALVSALVWFFSRRWNLLIVRETQVPVAATQLPPHMQKAKTTPGEQPVQPIQAGEGDYYHRIYQVDILHPTMSKEALFQKVFEDINQFIASEMASFEKIKGNDDHWEVSDEFFVHITGPWNGPVRLIDLHPTSFAFVTLKGHLEAGEIQFRILDHPQQEDAFRFEIRSWARSSNVITNFFYGIIGISKFSQTRMWTFFCKRVLEESGGELIGKINVMTHRVHYKPQEPTPLWKQYTNQFDRWNSAELNYDPSKRQEFTEINGWHLDEYMIGLPSERPGEPAADGSWKAAQQIVSNYEFPDPSLVTGIFVPENPLDKRIMIIRGRFLFFTFLFGVRVSQVIDELRDVDKRGEARVWGYGYRTLSGHFEMGEITFEIWKFLKSGEVEFQMHAYSKPANITNPFYRLGFRLFGRSLQKRFGATSLERMQQLVIERIADTTETEKPIETPEVQSIANDEDASRKVEEITQADEQVSAS